MSLADKLHIYNYEKVSILTEQKFVNNELVNAVLDTLNILQAQGLNVPYHTVIIFPADFRNDEVPVSYTSAKLIFIFATTGVQLMYQYLHELGHIIFNAFPEDYRWIGELISCSFNYFFYPKNSHYYQTYILPQVKSLQQCKANYETVKKDLPKNPYLVYNGEYSFDSAIYSYMVNNEKFNFVSIINEAISSQGDPNNNDYIPFLTLILQAFDLNHL